MKASIGMMILVLAGAPALAQPPEETKPATAQAAARQASTATAIDATQAELAMPDVRVDGDGALNLEELADLRGGEAIVIQHTTQTMTAVNTGNSVNGDTIGSGAVNLGSGAFNGYDGIGNFVINTGHNNNLQGSISVSIAMTPQ
jgi:hypothetical protein